MIVSGDGRMEVCGNNLGVAKTHCSRAPSHGHGALAIDLGGEWTTYSAREDKRPFVCKRSRDGGKEEGGEGGQHLLWILISASAALLLVLALVVLVLAFLVFTRGKSQLSRNSK